MHAVGEMKQASMSKTVDQGKEEVAKLCQYFTTNRQAFLARNEAQVRQWLIDPLFEALGWDVRNKAMTAPQYQEVIHEDSLDVEGQQKAPDYTFPAGGGEYSLGAVEFRGHELARRT